MIPEMTLVDWVGVVGSCLIAGAYMAVSRGWLAAQRPAFNLLNLAGACLILVSLYWRPNAGAIVIEILWVLIAAHALFRYLLGR